MGCGAITKLVSAESRLGGAISVGLEPAPEYVPDGFSANPEGYLDFFKTVIDATRAHAAAYKPNLAFFEALGRPGWDLLFKVRELVPSDAVFIADAKRSDIGSTAKRYARALFDELNADAVTVNPLMGRDSVEPFLEFEDRLTFALVLTSNPGADDFLTVNDLHLRIARKLVEWSRGNVGFVVGATRPEMVRAVREVGAGVPFLVPGVGAQGGEVSKVASAARATSDGVGSGMVIHATRSLLPSAGDEGDVGEIIEAKANALLCELRAALGTEREAAHG
jgi:orotidine-5'-phosphate decarboxylase